jgi:hypothetical protein
MKRSTLELVVYACMFIVIYHNWTYFPREPQVVHGSLIKIGVE